MKRQPHEKPILIVIAGPNGSGKTSFSLQIRSHRWYQDCIFINPDEIALKKYGDWNSHDAVLKAAQYAERVREKYLQRQQSLAFETVFSSPPKVDYVKRAIKADFFVRFFFIGTDSPTINVNRIGQRVAEGGHSVPLQKIFSRYTKSLTNLAQILQVVHRGYIFDNSIDDEIPKLQFRTEFGTLKKTYQTNHDWAEQIRKYFKDSQQLN